MRMRKAITVDAKISGAKVARTITAQMPKIIPMSGAF
jgi:hypothetical protein